MSHRLTHVNAMIARFDSPNSTESGKPPIAPKPGRVKPSSVSQDPPQRNVDNTDNNSQRDNYSDDSQEFPGVSKPMTTTKRIMEWPPQRGGNESPESSASQSDVASDSNDHQKLESLPSGEVQPVNDVTNSEGSSDQNNSSATPEIVVETGNSPTVDHAHLCDSSASSLCGDDVDEVASKASSTSHSETSKPKKSYEQVIDEIVRTERTFVDDLKALFECYQAMLKVNGERKLDLEKQIEDVFSDFVPIFRLHSETFLPIMEKQYAESEFWIGRVFNDNNFIVKTYKPFIVKQTENEKTLLELLKNPFISGAVDEVLKNYKRMLGCANGYNVIFQRITRYSLLLKEYIKQLPDDCPDREVAMMAMGKINDAAFQLNQTKKNADDFNKQVLNVLDRITRGRQVVDLQPWERFVKEGPVEKISARSSLRVQSRYIFLFSGRLLLCESSLGGYNIKSQMEVATMHIEEINGPNKHPNSFRIRAKQKIIDLKFDSEDSENDWRDAVNREIAADRERRVSFMRLGLSEETKRVLGKQAPPWVKDEECSMCMRCCGDFTLKNRRHHCRACGHLVCGPCSNYKHNLQYLKNASARVCQRCKEALSTSEENPVEDPLPEETIPDMSIESYLLFADNNRQFKEKYAILSGEGWIRLKTKCKDRRPWRTIPIVGFAMSVVEDNDLCFKLSHPSCEYYFSPKSKELMDKWMDAIKSVLQEFE